MRLVTNPGTNMSPSVIAEHNIEVLPQHIVVDDVHHDTRAGVVQETVDQWVAQAKVHPYVLGTSAAQFAGHLSRLGAEDPELLVIMSSRKIIQSFTACTTASKTLAQHPKWKHLQIRIVDTGTTDVGAGLAATYAAEAIAAGLSLDEVFHLCEQFSAATRVAIAIQEMDNLVKGGRASFLKMWAAKFLGVRPIVAFADGQLEPARRYKVKSDPVAALRDWVLEEVEPSAGGRVWVAASHGGVPEQAEALVVDLESRLDVRRRLVAPTVPSIHLHGGPGSIMVAVTDVERLDWIPGEPTERASTGR